MTDRSFSLYSGESPVSESGDAEWSELGEAVAEICNCSSHLQDRTPMGVISLRATRNRELAERRMGVVCGRLACEGTDVGGDLVWGRQCARQ